MRSNLKLLGLTAAGWLLAAPLASAEMVQFKAALNGAAEVPANDSAGSGTAEVSLDTDAKKVTWKVTQQGLSGEPTAAHFHGPAAAGENAGPALDISGTLAEGTSDLTDAQITDLQAGKWYVNVHTEKFPDGEIRGQVEKGM
ncbi:MAG: CHRD domain-containing protein [Pseudomonadota bacterium]|nr:CHRD domain-containing protein [Pseudomonadota bacterium]